MKLSKIRHSPRKEAEGLKDYNLDDIVQRCCICYSLYWNYCPECKKRFCKSHFFDRRVHKCNSGLSDL